MADKPVLIRALSLVKRYGRRAVVDGISLTVNAGEVLAVIGPNGAGKSTALDLILRLRAPDEGAVEYVEARLGRRIGVQLQSTPLFPGFTALENMRLAAAFHRLRMRDDELLRRLAGCGLAEAAKTDAARLSGGQQKRLAIAMALVHDPKLLFLDEPTAALDPRARLEVREAAHPSSSRRTRWRKSTASPTGSCSSAPAASWPKVRPNRCSTRMALPISNNCTSG